MNNGSKMAFDYDSIPGDYQFRALTKGYRLQRFWHQNKIRVRRELLPISVSDTILEVGCGSGNLLLDACASARRGLGVDISAAALKFCHSLNPGNCLLVRADGSHLPVATNSTDKAMLIEVLEHLSNPEEFILEMKRVLVPGGMALITTPNYSVTSLWPLVERLLDITGMTPKMAGAQHITLFDRKRLERVVRQAGLDIVKLGSFYSLSAFLSMLSTKLAERTVLREIERNSEAGMLQYCLARKPAENGTRRLRDTGTRRA
ncbi:MAG TPA: methyltransferase domain-containing protein [Acidobacteriota bacterium]